MSSQSYGNRHFIDIAEQSARTIRTLLEAAKARKQKRVREAKGVVDKGAPLKGYTLGMLFEKPSTRTRLSFEMGMHQLGGKSLILQGDAMQLGRGESVEDTARVMSRMVDAVMIRANDHDSVVRFAEAGSIPVINALTNKSHPCQLMADIMTIEETLGPVEGKTIAWVGDGNNMAQSLVEIAESLNFSVVMASPEAYRLKTNSPHVTHTADPFFAVKEADAVMTDTWVSMGDQDEAARKQAFTPFQVNEKLMQGAPDQALFLHCLPAHRGEEVTDAVLDGPQSVVWDQAENRLHVQKAILLWALLGESGLML